MASTGGVSGAARWVWKRTPESVRDLVKRSNVRQGTRAAFAWVWDRSLVLDRVAPRGVAWAMSVVGFFDRARPAALARKARVATWESDGVRIAWCDEALNLAPTAVTAAIQKAALLHPTAPDEAEGVLLSVWALTSPSGRQRITDEVGYLDPVERFTTDRVAAALQEIAAGMSTEWSVTRRSALVRALCLADHPTLAADRLESLGCPRIDPGSAWVLVVRLHRRGEIRRPLQLAEAYKSGSSPKFEVFIAARERELEILEHGVDVTYPTFSYTAGTTTRSLYLLHNSLPHQSGGYATRTHGLLTALHRLGQPTVGVTRPGFPAKKGVFQQADVAPLDVIDGVPYRRLIGAVPSLPRTDLDGFTKVYVDLLRPVMDEYRPALLHAASNWWNGMAATRGAAAAGIPSIYEVRGLWEVTRWSRQAEWGTSETFQLDARYEAEAAKAADRVITITTALKQEMVRRGVEESKISVVPNAVDIDRFSKVERDPAVARALGFEGSVVIGFAGSITFYEGLDDLLHAAAQLRGNTKVPFGLLFVGDGAVKADLEALAVELGVDDLCRFVGRVPHHEVEQYLGIMDITPFPRKPLPVCEMVSPLKPLESMASGVSVMVSSVDALLEMVDYGACGAVFQKGDNDDFARVLGQMIDDPEMRRGYVEHARGWVAENRSWLAVAKTAADLYDELAPRR